MAEKKLIGVDLDATLATYTHWEGVEKIGAPRPGVRQFLQRLRQRYLVEIFTTRCKADMPGRDEMVRAGAADAFQWQHQAAHKLAELVRRWLIDHGLPFDSIYTGQGKPPYAAIVDDRAVACPPNPNTKDFLNLYDRVVAVAERA